MKGELMRLIDADAYKKYLEENCIVANYLAIDVQPTIDAIPVVRCKDCEFFSKSGAISGMCTLRGDFIWQNDYCSYGQKEKENDDPT